MRVEMQTNAPPRKIYSLTPSGREEFIEILNNKDKEDIYRSPFMLMAMFAPLLDQQSLKQHLIEREQYILDKLARLEKKQTSFDRPATLWTLGYGVAVCKAELAFLKENGATLVGMGQKSK